MRPAPSMDRPTMSAALRVSTQRPRVRIFCPASSAHPCLYCCPGHSSQTSSSVDVLIKLCRIGHEQQAFLDSCRPETRRDVHGRSLSLQHNFAIKAHRLFCRLSTPHRHPGSLLWCQRHGRTLINQRIAFELRTSCTQTSYCEAGLLLRFVSAFIVRIHD